MAKGQADVVETFDETELPKRVNFKCGFESVLVGDGLLFERDGKPIVRNCLRIFEQLSDLVFAESSEDDSILAGI